VVQVAAVMVASEVVQQQPQELPIQVQVVAAVVWLYRATVAAALS
jgi:hypothetical protein